MVCSFCGLPGHKRPTCPTLAHDRAAIGACPYCLPVDGSRKVPRPATVPSPLRPDILICESCRDGLVAEAALGAEA